MEHEDKRMLMLMRRSLDMETIGRKARVAVKCVDHKDHIIHMRYRLSHPRLLRQAARLLLRVHQNPQWTNDIKGLGN